MVEAAVALHHPVEDVLALVAERRVAEIVGERDGFRQVLVEAQHDSLQLEAPPQAVLAVLLLAGADLPGTAVLVARHFQLGVDGGTNA